MVRIFTHFNVDLDAVASVWFWLRFKTSEAVLKFCPANWSGDEMSEADVALDIEAGGRGLKGEQDADGTVHSCFASLVRQHCSSEDQQALAELALFVDAQDTGNAAKNLGVSDKQTVRVLSFTGLNAVLRAFQNLHPRNDEVVCEKMFEVLDGLLKGGRSRIVAEAEADQAELVGNGKVAIVRDAQCIGTNGVLFDRGIQVVVFIDGTNLGVIRSGDVTIRMDHDDIKAVVAGEDGWFFHPAGFLTARGTRKAPAETLSAVDPLVLAEAVVRVLLTGTLSIPADEV